MHWTCATGCILAMSRLSWHQCFDEVQACFLPLKIHMEHMKVWFRWFSGFQMDDLQVPAINIPGCKSESSKVNPTPSLKAF